MKILNDTKLLRELDTLRNEYDSAYLNLKRNITSAYQMYLVQKAETDFRNKSLDCFRCYLVDDHTKNRFAAYCGVDFGERIYYMIKNTEDFGMVFVMGKNNIVVSQKPFFNEDTVLDILFTFELQMTICSPEDIY